jgi:hypothetical protein
MSDILGSNVIAVRTPDSITGGVTYNPLDFYKPFTFTEWVVRTQSTETDSAYLLNQYKFYLLSWHKAKKIDKKEVNDFVRSSFINLLKEIVLSYSTLEERRFITNIDFTNDLDLYSVLPFFVSKIKTICNYYSILRENVKFKKYENNLKGSEGGVLTVITNEIIKSLNSLLRLSTSAPTSPSACILLLSICSCRKIWAIVGAGFLLISPRMIRPSSDSLSPAVLPSTILRPRIIVPSMRWQKAPEMKMLYG